MGHVYAYAYTYAYNYKCIYVCAYVCAYARCDASPAIDVRAYALRAHFEVRRAWATVVR